MQSETKRAVGELSLTSSVARRGMGRADGVPISPTPPQDIAPGSVNSARCSQIYHEMWTANWWAETEV
jgi:hypothetical protein